MEKKKIIKIILFIILILIVIFLGNIIRKMLIINDMNNKVSKYIDNDNHYEKIINNSGNTETITEYYCKGDKTVMFLTTTNKETGEKRKLTQYFKEEKTNSYFEVEKDKLAVLDSDSEQVKVMIFDIDYGNNLWDLFYLALTTPIKSVDYKDKQCYFLDSPVTRYSYIEKDTGLTLRAIDGQVEAENKSEVEYYYEFDNVDDSIFVEPDISEYRIQENN